MPLRGKQISQEMRRCCENIVQRISHVTFEKYKLSRLVLYFKPDKNNTLYFLFANSVRMENEHVSEKVKKEFGGKIKNTPLRIEGTQFVKPEEIKLAYTTNTMRPVRLDLDLTCLQCEQLIQGVDLVSVPYRFIVQTYRNYIEV